MSNLSPFLASLYVAAGGGAGAVLRYQTGRAMTHWLGTPLPSFPFATLTVNAVGSLLMGLLAGWLARHGSGAGEQLRLLLGIGLLGGFTTFSAFSLEMVLMIERGQLLFASLYAVLSFALGIGGLMAGLVLMRIAS